MDKTENCKKIYEEYKSLQDEIDAAFQTHAHGNGIKINALPVPFVKIAQGKMLTGMINGELNVQLAKKR